VQVDAKDRKRLEQLCRHITCPALSDEWAQLTAARQVELKLKTPWRDGSTHLAMSLMEFNQRLAALVLQPTLHLPMTASWPSISAIGCPVWVGSGYFPAAGERQVHVGNPADETAELCSRGAAREAGVIRVTCVVVRPGRAGWWHCCELPLDLRWTQR